MRQLQMCAPLKRSPASVLPHPSHGASEKYGSYSLPSTGMSSTRPSTPLIPSPHSSIISPICASVPSPLAIICTQSGQNSRSSTLTVAIVLSSSVASVCNLGERVAHRDGPPYSVARAAPLNAVGPGDVRPLRSPRVVSVLGVRGEHVVVRACRPSEMLCALVCARHNGVGVPAEQLRKEHPPLVPSSRVRAVGTPVGILPCRAVVACVALA